MSIPTVAESARFVDDTLASEVDPNGTGAYDGQPGSDNAVLVSVLTKVMTKLYAYAADRKRQSIGATADGSDLEDHIRDVYFDKKKPANASKGTVYLTRVSSATAKSVGAGSRFGTKKTDTRAAIEFEALATIPAAVGVTAIAVPVECLQEGIIGNVDLADVTEILDPLGEQWTLYVPIAGDAVLAGKPAPDVISGGEDAESDDDVKARVLQRPAKAAPGTKAGVYKGVTDVPGIKSAVPIEVGDGTGVVFAGDDNDQLSEANQRAVAANLEDWRPFGVPVAPRPFSRTLVQVAAQVHMQETLDKYDVDQLRRNAIAAVKRYFKTERKRPEEYFVNAIEIAIGKANAGTQTVNLISPTLDVKRQLDINYAVMGSLPRYYVDDTSIDIQFFDPMTS